jgi:Ca2+-binding EF-hand superfamily protein
LMEMPQRCARKAYGRLWPCPCRERRRHTRDTMAQLSDEERITKARKIFAQFDTNHDGVLTETELVGLLRTLGQPSDPDSVRNVLNRWDADGDGIWDFSEFLSAAYLWLRQPNEAQLLEAFNSFDSNHDGYLSAAELSLALEALGIPCTPAEADEKVREADLDRDGSVDFEEFARAVFASQ